MSPSPTPVIIQERWQLLDEAARDPNRAQRALDLHNNRPVLLKPVPRAYTQDPSAYNTLLATFHRWRRLDHPYIIRTVALIDEAPGQSTLVVEHQHATSLEALLTHHGRLPSEVALLLVRQLLEALSHLSQHELAHGQLTPERVLVRLSKDGTASVALTDFAIAPAGATPGARDTLLGMRAMSAMQQLSLSPYTAPEQLSLETDSRSDLYAAGTLLFHMLTGELPLPLRHDTPKESMARIIMSQPRLSLSGLRPEFSGALDALLRALTQIDAQQRPPHVGLVIEAIESSPEFDQVMVPIPERSFWRGSREDDPSARPEEQPAHTCHLAPFFLDRLPVTRRQFAQFLAATQHPMPEQWAELNTPERTPDLPVVFVNWFDARAYAEWAGKRLPSEAEWEHAARGTDGRTYPWGEQPPQAGLAHFGEQTHPLPSLQHRKGASPYGVIDMAGNCFEWVEDIYRSEAYKSLDTEYTPSLSDLSRKKRVLKGGSFCHPAEALRCAARGRYAPKERRINHSFRCAFSLL